MVFLRFLLFPFAIIYGLITGFRNILYNKGILRSSKFDLPIIGVGNLSAGGTGKTPHVEYIINLLKNKTKLATLSRGYGRKTVGFNEATNKSTYLDVGDEPLQFYLKFKESVRVFVQASRVMGVIEIIQKAPNTNCIVLDDCLQHRAIEPGLKILLTTYKNPYFSDHMLPVGNLREYRKGHERANILVVSKCPKNITKETKKDIIKRLKPLANQSVFFSKINYGEIKSFNQPKTLTFADLTNKSITLVTGIANPKSFVEKVYGVAKNVEHIKFPDHHRFRDKDISRIIDIFDALSGNEKIILTTEKDAVRLKSHKELTNYPVFYTEITTEIIDNKNEFDNLILSYVEQNQRDC